MDLVAHWKRPVDEYYEAPDVIRWANGSKATLADYERHIDDTRYWIENGINGRELHVCPDVVAVVTYDPYGGVWCAKGYGVETTGIDIDDPMAADDQIIAALNSGHMTYRVQIIR